MSPSFTDYMNKSIMLKGRLMEYCLNKYEAQEIRDRLNIINCFDELSKDNYHFRCRVLAWIDGKGSTIELRKLCKNVGFDYWISLDIANMIDTIDSAVINLRSKGV